VKRVGVAAALAVAAWTSGARAQTVPPAPETIAVGDWQLAPLVEVRARGEYRRDVDGQDRGAILERARLGVDAQRGAIEARVVVQDARVWSAAASGPFVAGPEPLGVTGVYEAWGGAHTASARPSFVRVGRQPVTWGEGRLLGIADWSPTGRSLDAVRGRLVAGDFAFELLAASLSEPDAATFAYGELLGARAEWAIDPLLALEAYGLGRLAQRNPATSLDASVRGQTYAAAVRAHGDARSWTWGVEGAYQLGHADDVLVGGGTGADRAAWAAAAHVAYTLEHVLLLPTFRAGASYASGDSGGSTYRAFDPMLPDVHVWHGAMDVFAWSNEEEVSARAAVAPWTDAIAAVEYRYARLAEAGGVWRSGYLQTIGAAPGGGSSELGHEIDAVLAWSPWVPVDLTAGYSALLLGDGARGILAASRTASPPDVLHFAYLQATLHVP
jgi:hypothetical protein